ncbi:MAG: amino acid permease [Bacteroidota bacterium]
MEQVEAPSKLSRRLNTFDLTMIVIGSIIGSGIFITPSSIAQSLPSAGLILFVWTLGGLLALTGALTYGELSALMPKAGGVYVYLSEAYGGVFGFLYGWANFLVINTGALAALAIVYATYFGYFVPLSELGIKAVAIMGIILLTFINYFGVRAGGVFSDVFTLLKLIGICGLIFFGFLLGRGQEIHLRPLIPQLEGNLGAALAMGMVGVLWSYGGWQHATFTSGEAKDPQRSLPFSIIAGTIIVIIIYLLANLVYLYLLPIETIASSPRVAALAAERFLGSTGGGLISLAILISTFGTSGIYTLTAPRIYYAMAEDGVFFKRAAYVHPKYRTPIFSIIFQSAWAIVLILSGNFLQLITYVAFTDWIFFALTTATVLVFRRKFPEMERPYRTWGYPITPIFFILVSSWFVINTLVNSPTQALVGLGFLAVGVPVYYFW